MNLAPAIARWHALAPRRRIALAATASALVAFFLIVSMVMRDTRVALFANSLKADQLAEVDAQLSAWNVAFTPVADNVRVEAKRRSELLARLALAGVPHAHVIGTSEALASLGTLTPQAILDAQARAGLEGDLEKGLRGIGGIADARIILAPAHGGTFADESPTPASASVRLSAAAGTVLTPATLAAVRAFVAAGVPGLRAERVTVVDDRGVTADGASGDRNDEARDREVALQSALDAAFGIGATIVRVRVERDERIRDAHEVRRLPYKIGPVIVRNELSERFSGEKKSYAKLQTSEDRGSETHEERTHLAAGAIARISIAVIVDLRRGLDLAKIREVAVAAGGVDRRRGDTLSVEAVPFDRPQLRAAPPFAYVAGIASEAIPALALFAVFFVAVRAVSPAAVAAFTELARRMRIERTAPSLGRHSPRAIYSVLRDEPPYAAAAIIARLGAPVATAVLEMYGEEERRAIVARLARKVSPLVPDAEGLLHDG